MKKIILILTTLLSINFLYSITSIAESLNAEDALIGNTIPTNSYNTQSMQIGDTIHSGDFKDSENFDNTPTKENFPDQSPTTNSAGDLAGLTAAGIVATSGLFQKSGKLNTLSANELKIYNSIKPLLSKKIIDINQLKKLMSTLTPEEATNVGKALNEDGFYIPGLVSNAPSSEDATSRPNTLYMGSYHDDDPNKFFIKDLANIAKKEDFKLSLQVDKNTDIPDIQRNLISDSEDIHTTEELSKITDFVKTPKDGYEWAEDNKWLTSDQSTIVTTPSILRTKTNALNKTKDFATGSIGLTPTDPNYALEGSHGVGFYTTDPLNVVDEGSFQGSVANRQQNENAKELAAATKKQLLTTRTYNEGGNMLTGVKPNGNPYALIGRDGLLTSTFLLNENYNNNPSSVPEFSDDAIKQKMNSMTFDQTSIKQTVERLSSAGELNLHKPQNEQAKVFLTKMEITKQIMADELNIPLDSVAFVSQPDFHIDMHMRPLAPGQVLLNDETENQKLIQTALQKSSPDSWEEAELKNMLEYSKIKEKVTSPVTNLIENQIRSIGVDVIRAPGSMEGKMSTGNVRFVNFMNAIPGTSKASNDQFYITNYTSLTPLREAYEDYIKSHGIEKVYWVGKSGGGKDTLSESEKSLILNGGADCRENH